PPRFNNAPVSGGTAGAEKGSFTFMQTMGSTVNPCGGPSLGLAAKLLNNYLSGFIALATTEAMNVCMRCGLDAKVLLDCFATGSGSVCPDAVTSRDHQGGFKVQLMKKDMSLGLADAGLSACSAASEDPHCRDRASRVIYRWLGGYEPEVEQDHSDIVP
ncbi:NAD-binding of NADP-dependent 3-hydroxyisobutyrate dehydrogenase-domain-containing protein, partial [Gautieria morchelliformis]